MEYWQFSQSSLPLLEDCLRVPLDNSLKGSKWKDLFKRTEETLPSKEECLIASYNDSFPEEEPHDDNDISTNVVLENEEENIPEIDNVCAKLESAPNSLDILSQLRVDNECLLPLLAEKLSKSSAREKILENLIHTNHEDNSFVSKFFLHFAPVCIKHETASVALDLLINIYKRHPELYRSIMITLLMDAEMTSKVLEEFFITINGTEQSQYLSELAVREISKEAFIQHLNTIRLLYKSSPKSFEVQNFMLEGLAKSATACTDDKSYGSLMLMFFKAVKEREASEDMSLLKLILDTHSTAFKKLCINIFNNLKPPPEV